MPEAPAALVVREVLELVVGCISAMRGIRQISEESLGMLTFTDMTLFGVVWLTSWYTGQKTSWAV